MPRHRAALLPGVVVCGNCGRYRQASYHANSVAQYSCHRHYVEATEPRCYGLSAAVLDELVAQQVLRALEPAAVQLSLQAQADMEQERQQRQQRARYELTQAERRYLTVDPENRLVAATLEKRWAAALRQERALQEQYDRFGRATPSRLSAAERARIESLSAAISLLWQAQATTNADRQQIVRCVVERVVVDVRCNSEYVSATIHWAGGFQTQHEFVRPVATYAQLRDFPQLLERVVQLRQTGHTAAPIAAKLNGAGFYPPQRSGSFTVPVVYQLLKRRALLGNERAHDELLRDHEWWLTDLARELQMRHSKLRDWANRGWLHSRRTPIQGRWILWADPDEVVRLQTLLEQSRRGVNAYPHELKTPKACDAR